MKISTSTFVSFLFLCSQSDAFTSTPSKLANVPQSWSRLYTANDEKTVRAELKEKTSLVDAEDEINYPIDLEETITTSPKGSKDIEKMIARATKPRAYPLFLAEKGALLLEDAISSFAKFRDSESEGGWENPDHENKKEKIVILGTGWGAAAFLKEIDTSLYDVTVISPRNHFLFTPMLAGASVGTVEFRSITESIREVSFS